MLNSNCASRCWFAIVRIGGIHQKDKTHIVLVCLCLDVGYVMMEETLVLAQADGLESFQDPANVVVSQRVAHLG